MPLSTRTLSLIAVASVLVAGTSRARQPEGAAAEREQAVVDRLVAVVQIRSGVSGRGAAEPARMLPPSVITLSGLDFEARVALIKRGGIEAAHQPLDEDALQSALELSIDERLLAGEAEALEAWNVEPAEVETAVRGFAERFKSTTEFDAFLEAHEADTQTLARVLERSLRAVRVLDSKVRLRAQVSESEVRRYFEAHRSEIPGDWEEVRSALREKLIRERTQELVKRELEQLRRTHDVRRIAPLASKQRGEGEG